MPLHPRHPLPRRPLARYAVATPTQSRANHQIGHRRDPPQKDWRSTTQAWLVTNVSDSDDGVWITNNSTELAVLQALEGKVEFCGFGDDGEVTARERWSTIRRDPIPAIARIISAVVGIAVWHITALLLASTDIPIAAGLLAGATPFYVPQEDRGLLLYNAASIVWRLARHVARIANDHGAVTCTLVGLFFLVRGQHRHEPEPDNQHDPEHDTDSDIPANVGTAGHEIKHDMTCAFMANNAYRVHAGSAIIRSTPASFANAHRGGGNRL